MKSKKSFLYLAVLVAISVQPEKVRATDLLGRWERQKLICSSGSQPDTDWETWKINIKFENPNFYTLIRKRDEFTSFETGEYYFTNENQVCFKKDFPSDALPLCYKFNLGENYFYLNELMLQDAECPQGDYVEQYFKIWNPTSQN